MHSNIHMHTYTHKYVYVCIYIYLYRHVQLQNLTKASAKHMDTTTGQPLPVIFSKIGMKQKLKRAAVSHTCCHTQRLQILAPFPRPSRGRPGLSELLSLHGLRAGTHLHPRASAAPANCPLLPGGHGCPSAPGSPLGAGTRLLPLLGASPRAPHSMASAARQPAPTHPILRQANPPSPAPKHPFGAVYLGGKK